MKTRFEILFVCLTLIGFSIPALKASDNPKPCEDALEIKPEKKRNASRVTVSQPQIPALQLPHHRLTIGTLNVARYFRLNQRELSDKSRREKAWLIDAMNADFLIPNEDETTPEELAVFKQLLKTSYKEYIPPTLDHRGLVPKLYVKSQFDYDVEIISHLDETYSPTDGAHNIRLFKRNLPVFLIKPRKSTARAAWSKQPQNTLWIMGVHLQSLKRRADEIVSPEVVRAHQIARLKQIIKKMRMEYGEMFALAGDYNSDLLGPDFADFFTQRGLRLSNPVVSARGRPDPQELFTHVYFPKDGPVQPALLDGVLISSSMWHYVQKSRIVRLPRAPQTIDEALSFDRHAYYDLATDHAGVVVKFR